MLKTTLTAAGLTAALLLPSTASAWTVQRTVENGEIVTFTAAPGEQNVAGLGDADGQLRLTSGGTPSALAPCAVVAKAVECPFTGQSSLVRLFLGDQADTALVGAFVDDHPVTINLAGEEGHDVLSNDDKPGAIGGGPGDDVIRPGKGADTVTGGSGVDILDYSERTTPVKVTFGSPGTALAEVDEQDSFSEIEAVYGGKAGDILFGQNASEIYTPRGGKDLVTTNGGNDVVDSREGVADEIDCGAGTDTVHADLLDKVAANCETVIRKHHLAGGDDVKPLPPGPGELPQPVDPEQPPAPDNGSGSQAPAADAGTAAPSSSAESPAPAPTAAVAPPARDRTAPRITRLRVDRRGIVRFTLSERAAVTLTVQRCGKRRCTPVRTLRRTRASGRMALNAGRRTLRRGGRYRLSVVATDAAGNRSRAATKRLRVRRTR